MTTDADTETDTTFSTTAPAPTDARRSDFVRRRAQVVDAYIDLALEGDPAPSQPAVAARAGVSRSSMFRYFDTLDDLRHAAMGRVFERFIELFDLGDAPPSRRGRIADFVDLRLRFHETIGALALIQRHHATTQPDAATLVDASRNLLADQVRTYFAADLAGLDTDAAADLVLTIAVLTSVESWQQLRDSHGRRPPEIRRPWIATIDAAIAAASPSDPRGAQ
ncbi:MAG: TetR/AcrR family transcriptional regulator [Actinomycetota bacterium]